MIDDCQQAPAAEPARRFGALRRVGSGAQRRVADLGPAAFAWRRRLARVAAR
jgi:hypothetical protein